ncbi:fungal-specific transcription factor domain-containing protein [Podospora australis]|uniref:Fungal-specific transcription factor domain-containing protein n=1 Tax=Podospora australis TaxID=1536484 RepID=A0AAN6WM71_9PEZI|nr:fungal-specific transcription factor domain-containing protein [Podospora australis]
MESVSQLSRRKACDLCFVKKIKCDMVKPQCSNCKQYSTDCKTTAVRRRIGQPKKQTGAGEPNSIPSLPTPPESDALSGPVESPDRGKQTELEARLSRIEAQLQQVLSVASAVISLSNNNAIPTGRPEGQDSDLFAVDHKETLSGWFDNDALPALEATMSTSSSSTNSSPSEVILRHPLPPNLPPLAEIGPIINAYFSQINSVIPLFSQKDFTRMLSDWYTFPVSRTRAFWAVVNIVLALGSKLPTTPVADMDFSQETSGFQVYMRNAQSVLSELVTRDSDLLGLQAMLGLVLLHNTLPDPRPGAVLIGAAVRLVHRLRLQSKMDIEALYPEDEAVHRCRLFWITYMLDKEICLMHHTPSVQCDEDIDQDLPSPAPADGVGDIYTADGLQRVNYLRLRVRLAHLHGKVYDLLYSTRSRKLSPTERTARVVRLSTMLEKWRLSIPSEMSLTSLSKGGSRPLGRLELAFMFTLQSSWFHCMVMVHGIWSTEAAWVRKNVSPNGLATLEKSETDSGRKCCMGQNPPLPSAWKRTVEVSRECLAVASQLPESDCNVWSNCGAFFSALVILLSNLCEYPGHEDLEQDRMLVRWVMNILQKIRDLAVIIPLQSMEFIVIELERRAEIAIAEARRKRLMLEERLRGVWVQGFAPAPESGSQGSEVAQWDGAAVRETSIEEAKIGAVDISGEQGLAMEMFEQQGGPFEDWTVSMQEPQLFDFGAAIVT